MVKILIVDDEESIIRSLSEALELEGYETVGAGSLDAAFQKIYGASFDIVLLDLWLPDGNGMDFLREIIEFERPPGFIVMTGHGSIDTAVEATKLGGYAFLEKPLDLEKLLTSINNCIKWRSELYESENWPEKSVPKESDKLPVIIGTSPAITRVIELAKKTASSEGRILVTGENGTGKELIAELIHKLSPRKGFPFIKINCAAIPSELIESELFGHEHGAFTGASARKVGRFELADGGTLFLDEVGDMDLAVQAKVLRAVQQGEFERVGGVETIRVDVRLVSATNKDLRKEVELGNFREDLFYRLNVVPIHLPPLRERKEDIPLLVRHFLKTFCERDRKNLKSISKNAMDFLTRLPWKGNVRELQNIVERLVILVDGDVITLEDTENIIGHSCDNLPEYQGGKLKSLIEEYERKVILSVLGRTGGNMSRAAELIGLERSALYRKMDRLGIRRNP